MDASSSSQEAGPSALKTPVTDQSEWASSSTPSRQTFPRRLSLLQSDSAVSSPIRTPTSASVDSQSQSQQQQQQQQQQNDRMTSFTGPKPLSLSSQPMTSSVSGGSDTPRRGKRTSLSYIPSPSTSVKAGDDGPLSSASMGRTRTGSISRATSSASRRRPSQASQSAHSDAADDWLVSEEDASFSYPAAARAMGERDSAKVEAQFHDTGYREGITAGKLSTLQNGFDQGFNEVGAPLGRDVGRLRGQISALLHLLLLLPPTTSSQTAPTATARSSATAGRIRPSASSTGGSAGSSLPLLSHPGVEEAKVELRALAKVMDEVTLAKLAEPDYEALEHERQDLGEDDGNAVQRETVEEKRAREAILENLTQRLQQIRQMASRRTPSTDDPALHSQTLLRLIAEKERRCFELRDELASEESALASLRSTWQRLATRELAYSTSPTLHRRNGSTSSSLSNDATEAWNTLSSKLPGSLKTQLNNLLESIANVDGTQPPEPIEKEQVGIASGTRLEGEEGGAGSLLRPGGAGMTLGVLEEEGSDVGSVAALSPRSPRSPAVPAMEAFSPRAALKQPHADLNSLSNSSNDRVAADSSVLGFSVDESGLAYNTTAAASTSSTVGDERAPPTPAKPATPTWNSRRASVLGSLSSLSKQLTPTTETPTDSANGNSSTAGGGGFASLFAKRLKEARDNASDLLREAERKLGNAMTIDDLLGLPSSSSSPTNTRTSHDQPRIQLNEASFDSDMVKPPGNNSWYEAAGGRRSTSSEHSRRSPNLAPVIDASSADVGRLSISSNCSGRSSLSLPPLRAASPHASPPVGGLPGSAGVFGLLHGGGSQTDLTGGGGKRASAVSSASDWGWNGKSDDEDEWEAHTTPKVGDLI